MRYKWGLPFFWLPKKIVFLRVSVRAQVFELRFYSVDAAQFTPIHGRFGQPKKNPLERQAENPGIFLPHQ